MLKFHIELFVNKFRKEGTLNEKLPYPNYVEFRPADKFQSREESRVLNIDKKRYEQGFKLMQKFILTKSFVMILNSIMTDSLKEYIKVVKLHNIEEWELHPLLKAIMIGFSQIDEQMSKERFMSISLDKDTPQTNLAFSVLMTYQLDRWTIEKIFDLTDKTEYDYSGDILEKLIRSEIVIEKVKGDDLTINQFRQALMGLGLEVEILKKEHIPEAIRIAKK